MRCSSPVAPNPELPETSLNPIADSLLHSFYKDWCGCVYTRACTHTCAWVCRCTCACVYVGVRGWCQVSCSLTLYLVFLKQSLSPHQEIMNVAGPTEKQTHRISLPLLPQCWDYRFCTTRLLGTQRESPGFREKYLITSASSQSF